jgi:hypothetical protein
MPSVFQMGFRDDFRGATLGQFDFGSLISVIPQLLNTGVQAYESKRQADRIKQAKDRAEEQQKQAESAQAAADEARKKAAAAQAAGLTPEGLPLPQTTLGMDPMMLAIGGLGLLGVGAALFMALRK